MRFLGARDVTGVSSRSGCSLCGYLFERECGNVGALTGVLKSDAADLTLAVDI